MAEIQIDYVRAPNGGRIAYGVAGNGPVFVRMPDALHLSNFSRLPWQTTWFDELNGYRVVMYDHLGAGLSDRERYDYTLEGLVAEVESVVGALGVEAHALFAGAVSVPAAICYAARNPQRVKCLMLNCGWAWTREGKRYRAMREGLEGDWNLFSEALTRIVAGASSEMAARVEPVIRETTNATAYRDYQLAIESHDVRVLLGQIRAPTLVLQQTGNRFHPEWQGQEIAEGIAAAHLSLYPFPAAEGIQLTLAKPFFHEHWPPDSREDHRRTGSDPRLSSRECEILQRLAQGDTNELIAARLTLSTRTVERHVQNIYTKLGVHNRAEATAYAIRNGLA